MHINIIINIHTINRDALHKYALHKYATDSIQIVYVTVYVTCPPIRIHVKAFL